MRLRLAARVALATLGVSALAVAVVAIGVQLVGSSLFARLMVEHGASVNGSYAMFDESITRVLLGASALAIAGSIALGWIFGRLIERPMAELAQAARQIATGDYSIRVHRPGAPEMASVADSFNQMAAALDDHQRQRRDLILNFAHELRTPLTNLHGYLEGLREDIVRPTPETFASLREEVGRLRRLSHSLDALAAGVDPVPQPELFDLVRVVNAVLELRRQRLERRAIALEVDLPPALPVRADPDSLAQVIGNLLQNAARYTPRGGSVWIQAEPLHDSALVSVSNTGPTIPREDLGHLFERFYRVEKSRDAARGGAGIGLAIVRQLVEGLGGQVGAESASGVSRFWFKLPA
ncbi:MAG: ATP-binding protein [Chloroflexota bacterium]